MSCGPMASWKNSVRAHLWKSRASVGKISHVSHKLHRLHPQHYKILELARRGKRNMDIALAMGVTRRTVSNVFQSPVFQEELARRRERLNREMDERVVQLALHVKQLLDKASPEAVQVHVDCLDDESPTVRLRSAKTILDLVMGKGGQEVGPPAVMMSAEQSEGLMVALREESEGLGSSSPDGGLKGERED